MRKFAIFCAVVVMAVSAGFGLGCAKRCVNCGQKVVHLTVLEGVNFAFDKADLLPIAYPILNKDLELLNKDPSLQVSVEGHCDFRGSDAYNQNLSERRAKSVYNYFVSKGINKSRLATIGYGRTRPLVPNTSEENMYKNRRVEIKILEPKK